MLGSILKKPAMHEEDERSVSAKELDEALRKYLTNLGGITELQLQEKDMRQAGVPESEFDVFQKNYHAKRMRWGVTVRASESRTASKVLGYYSQCSNTRIHVVILNDNVDVFKQILAEESIQMKDKQKYCRIACVFGARAITNYLLSELGYSDNPADWSDDFKTLCLIDVALSGDRMWWNELYERMGKPEGLLADVRDNLYDIPEALVLLPLERGVGKGPTIS